MEAVRNIDPDPSEGCKTDVNYPLYRLPLVEAVGNFISQLLPLDYALGIRGPFSDLPRQI